jgi:hypothetical protein
VRTAALTACLRRDRARDRSTLASMPALTLPSLVSANCANGDTANTTLCCRSVAASSTAASSPIVSAATVVVGAYAATTDDNNCPQHVSAHTTSSQHTPVYSVATQAACTRCQRAVASQRVGARTPSTQAQRHAGTNSFYFQKAFLCFATGISLAVTVRHLELQCSATTHAHLHHSITSTHKRDKQQQQLNTLSI